MNTIGIISLSNGLNTKNKSVIDEVIRRLNKFNITVHTSKAIYSNEGFTLEPSFRAEELMNLYENPEIEAIFDVSGGDLANEVLPFIDFDIIRKNPKPFFGYSDLSVILNSLYTKGDSLGFWFQLRNIAYDDNSLKLLTDYLLKNDESIFKFDYKFLQGDKMEGTVIGGNLRCNLKLAGTDYMPSFEDKILLIESLGGDMNKITTYLTQYKLMGAFNKVNGVILGTFIELEKNMPLSEAEKLILKIIDNKNLPVIRTCEIGHKADSKSIAIGKHYNFS